MSVNFESAVNDVLKEVKSYSRIKPTFLPHFINQISGNDCGPACALNALIYFRLKTNNQASYELNNASWDIVNSGISLSELESKMNNAYSNLVECTTKKFINNYQGIESLKEALKTVCDNKGIIIYSSTPGLTGHARLLFDITLENNLIGWVKDPLYPTHNKVNLDFIVKSIIKSPNFAQEIGNDYLIITKK